MKKKYVLYLLLILVIAIIVFVMLNPTDIVEGFKAGAKAAGR